MARPSAGIRATFCAQRLGPLADRVGLADVGEDPEVLQLTGDDGVAREQEPP